MINFSGIKRGDRALGVCRGTGEQVLSYGKKGAIAVGIDIRKETIEVVKAQKERRGPRNVSFMVVDTPQLPFKRNSFNFISICLGLP